MSSGVGPGGGPAADKLPAGNRGSKEVSPRWGEAVTSADPGCGNGHETVTGGECACGHNRSGRSITRGFLITSDGSDDLMARRRTLMTALAVTLALGVAACGGNDDSGGGGGGSDSSGGQAAGKVGVILPDTTSSPRWESADRPQLSAAFEAAGVDYDIQNAGGD